jgi:hypothetical protein
MQAYYKLMHNDFHYGNILIDNTIKKGGYYVYNVNNKVYYIPNTGILPKLFDFEYAMVYSNKMEETYPNKFIMGHCVYDKSKHVSVPNNSTSDDDDDNNVPCNYNDVYDVHYFLTSLLDLFISEELFNWVLKTYPEEVIPPDESTTESSSEDSSDSSSESSDSSSESSDSSSEDSSNKNSSESSDKNSSESSDDSSSESSNDSSHTEFLKDGRLINGVENKIKLPRPLELLENDFFKEFLIKPDDFDQSTAVYFTCNK